MTNWLSLRAMTATNRASINIPPERKLMPKVCTYRNSCTVPSDIRFVPVPHPFVGLFRGLKAVDHSFLRIERGISVNQTRPAGINAARTET
jgi:hypothetical protein